MKDHAQYAIGPAQKTFKVVGRHRIRFLNAMISMGLMKTNPGDVRFATMSTATGKHLGQMRVEIEGEHLTLVTASDTADRLIAGLTKHRVADDIRWTPADGDAHELVVWAKDAEALAAALAGLLGDTEAPSADTYADGVDAGGHAYRVSRLGATFSPVAAETAFIRSLADDDAARTAQLGQLAHALAATEITREAYEVTRIRALWPDDVRDLPEEEPTLAATRLVGTVDWDKGCFLGQEVFVMARDRGEAPKRLMAFRTEAPAPAAGTEVLTAEGKVAGRTGSTATDGDRAWVLALIRKRYTKEGALKLKDGRALTNAESA